MLLKSFVALSVNLEAASGFEPLNEGVADPSLSHLGTPPSVSFSLSSVNHSKGYFVKRYGKVAAEGQILPETNPLLINRLSRQHSE